jgi:hypothetical protein
MKISLFALVITLICSLCCRANDIRKIGDSSHVEEDKRLGTKTLQSGKKQISYFDAKKIYDAHKQEEMVKASHNARLKRIVIPELELKKVTVNEALDFLGMVALEYDKSKSRPYAIVKMGVPASILNTRLSFEAKDISLLDALNAVISAAGLKYSIGSQIIRVTPTKAMLEKASKEVKRDKGTEKSSSSR